MIQNDEVRFRDAGFPGLLLVDPVMRRIEAFGIFFLGVVVGAATLMILIMN